MTYRWLLKPKFLFIAPLLLVLLTAVACGSSTDESTPQPTATPIDVGAIVAQALAGQPAGVTAADMAKAVQDALAAQPGVTTDQVASEIAKALAAQPGVTTAEVARAIETALSAKPGVTSEDVAMAITKALEAQPGLSPEDIRKAVEEAIAKALPTATPVPTQPAGMMQPKNGGIIPMQSLCDPNLPMIHLASLCGSLHASPIYNSLVHLDPTTPEPLDIAGDLAKDWSISSDGLTYTFKIHENAMWHDGQPVTAEDARFSIQITTDPGAISKTEFPAIFEETQGTRKGSGAALLSKYLDSLRTVDSRTLEVKLKFPAAAFLTALSHDNIYMMPKHLLAEGKIPSFKQAENLIGSGPFTMKRYRKEVQTDHERNPNYFKEGKPYVDGLSHFPIVEAASIIAAYKTGQVLMADSILNGLNVSQATQLDQELKGKSTVYWAAAVSNIAVMMNTRVAPFDNPNVRKAMNLVLHRQPIIETVGQGQLPIGSPLPPGMSWSYPMEEALQFPGLRSDSSDPAKKHPGDLAEAQQLMKDAGAGPGFKSTLYCLRAEEYCDVAVLVKDQLKEFLGWDLTIEQGEVAPLWARFLEGDYTFAVQARSCGIFDPDGCFSTYGKGSQSNNQLTGYFNEKAQPLWEAQQVETDPAKRTKLMGQISDFLLEDSSDIPIYWAVKNWIVADKIQNFNMANMSSTYKQHEQLWCDPAC